LSAARELEHAYDELPFAGGGGLASMDVMRAQPLGNVLQRLCVSVDPVLSADVHMILALWLTDRDATFALELRKGVLQVHERPWPNAHLQLALDTAALYTMLRDIAGQVPELLQEGTVVLERGTVDQLRTYIACFDRPSRRLPALAAR